MYIYIMLCISVYTLFQCLKRTYVYNCLQIISVKQRPQKLQMNLQPWHLKNYSLWLLAWVSTRPTLRRGCGVLLRIQLWKIWCTNLPSTYHVTCRKDWLKCYWIMATWNKHSRSILQVLLPPLTTYSDACWFCLFPCSCVCVCVCVTRHSSSSKMHV